MKYTHDQLMEIEKLVAKYIFEYDEVYESEDGERGLYGRIFSDGLSWHLGSYTTDISAAWEIVERFQEDGWNCYLMSSKGENVFHLSYKKDLDFQSPNVETTSLAICIVALQAKGVNVEKELDI